MEINNRYIPREYLALKINYCKKQLAELPEVRVRTSRPDSKTASTILLGNHRYAFNSTKGQKLYNLLCLRESLECKLLFYNVIWNSYFKDLPLSDCLPQKVQRTLFVDYNKHITMNKAFFDSLSNDTNKKYPKNTNYLFNGINYRSASERDIAILYTELGIPFKYEPSVSLAGLPNPINPDFVLYIEELDTCKFHEHLGIKDSSDYLRITKIKYGNYTNAGLIPDLDILFTYDTAEMPFDIRYLLAKLNASIYGSIISGKNQSA